MEMRNLHTGHPNYYGVQMCSLDPDGLRALISQTCSAQLPFNSVHKLAQEAAGGYIDKRKIDNIMQQAKHEQVQRDLKEALLSIGECDDELRQAVYNQHHFY